MRNCVCLGFLVSIPRQFICLPSCSLCVANAHGLRQTLNFKTGKSTPFHNNFNLKYANLLNTKMYSNRDISMFTWRTSIPLQYRLPLPPSFRTNCITSTGDSNKTDRISQESFHFKTFPDMTIHTFLKYICMNKHK